MTESLAIQGCEFENVEDDPQSVVGRCIACLVCRGKFRGDAGVMRTPDGFTEVVAGGCIKYDIRPQIPAQPVGEPTAIS